MIRSAFEPRADYIQQLRQIGFEHYDLPSGEGGQPYWQEGICYIFEEAEVDYIQAATQELHEMAVAMVDEIVQSGDYPDYFQLEDYAKSSIEQSWRRADRSLLGRFDLVYRPEQHAIKMLEYNGDTPVALLEASIAQWDFIQQSENIPDQQRIQYNFIDEQLIATWQKYFQPQSLIHFAQADAFRSEDWCNLAYLMDTAYRAGMQVKDILMEDIGHAQYRGQDFLVDLDFQKINHIFKLYPWEWIFKTREGAEIQRLDNIWFEPPWKALLSNKAMLVKMWQMFPQHPYLLAAYAETEVTQLQGRWCKKAVHGREGSNIYCYDASTGQSHLGQGSHVVDEYHQWGYIYHEWYDLPIFAGTRPTLGSWVIGDVACGMSIREDANVITGNAAFFASHIFIPEGA
ncbi:glutathionylspermidine synthase family protein [Acinetobacter larvae]|uniref:Glutathionylspermidine synthase pre-ATP-grasp-like domain-containing protein n=1 Tax=Acinetobacter larvae TaxID=1789224 RepID=A0A1B2LWM2_9GAMM|nr:glutathionylspermidine synthase family protein [Acinetobacter larvae]AOA57335.1 hypothetical protein BFG52_02490 [Acinetobacter larvae]